MSVQKVQEYYGFTRLPFRNDIAPSMLARTQAHTEATARITWCVNQRAIGVITGEVGAGKTVAIRAATNALDTSRHMTNYLPNPAVGIRGMFHHIVAALGQVPAYHKATLAPQAASALASEQAERGRTPILVIDEAHLLDNQQMEAIRMLTNHDMDSGAPFATLLVGQPMLRQRLRLGVLAALDQRIGIRYTLSGMQPEETGNYINHHLKIAGRADTLFSDDELSQIHLASRGYPRAVNNLATNALTAACLKGQVIIDEKAARTAINEINSD